MNWKSIKKLISVVVGMVMLITLHKYDISIPGLDAVVLELVVGAGASFGVYQFTNET